MKRTIVLPLVLMLMLLMVAPVSAGPPDVVATDYDVDYAIPHNPCPGIEVRNHELYTERITSFYDRDGNLIRQVFHDDGVDNLYNPDNPGVVLSGHFVGTWQVDLLTEGLRAAGVPYHITAPGFGTVLVRAGRWELSYPDGQVAGKNSFNDPTDIEQFCSILAGD